MWVRLDPPRLPPLFRVNEAASERTALGARSQTPFRCGGRGYGVEASPRPSTVSEGVKGLKQYGWLVAPDPRVGFEHLARRVVDAQIAPNQKTRTESPLGGEGHFGKTLLDSGARAVVIVETLGAACQREAVGLEA